MFNLVEKCSILVKTKVNQEHEEMVRNNGIKFKKRKGGQEKDEEKWVGRGTGRGGGGEREVARWEVEGREKKEKDRTSTVKYATTMRETERKGEIKF